MTRKRKIFERFYEFNDIIVIGGKDLKNKERFSKNYTIKMADSYLQNLLAKQESKISIKQHLKNNSFGLEKIFEIMKELQQFETKKG